FCNHAFPKGGGMMDPHQSLFYGLGIVAFSIAGADKYIQQLERKRLHRIIEDWTEEMDEDFDNTEIIYSILQNAKAGTAISYEKGLEYIQLGSHYLSGKLQEKFVQLITLLAKAFPSSQQMNDAAFRFRQDIKHIGQAAV